jgi:uncharacterized tellurite resistance protein B-like protein
MTIQNEHEAAVAIFVAVIDVDGNLTEFEIQKISNTLVFCSRFRGFDLKSILPKAFHLKNKFGVVEVIKMAAQFIDTEFAKTFYAMLCDILCSDGKTNDTDIQLMAMVASELKLNEEEYLPIATSFMTRYAWNINVE